jgi:hypothetical protein
MSAVLSITVAIALGLLTNELFDISSWLAKRIARRSARIRYGDTDRAATRAEELGAYIEDRPGNLLKLFTAIGFFAAALVDRLQRRVVKSEEVQAVLESGPRYYAPDIPSRRMAMALFPTEKYRGEWRKHWFSPVRKMTLAAALCVVLTRWPDTFLPDNVVEYRYQIGAQVDGNGWSLSYLHVIWPLLPLWMGWCVLSWYLQRVSISNKRLIRVSGVLYRRFTTVALVRATDAQLRQSPMGRLLNYASITFHNVNWFHPMRRITVLPNPNEFFLQLSEETYEPEAVDERGAEPEEDLYGEIFRGPDDLLGPASPTATERPPWIRRQPPRTIPPSRGSMPEDSSAETPPDGNEDPLPDSA